VFGGLNCERANPEHFWFRGDYLLWWVKSAPLGGPLVTTDPTNGATSTAGGLADPTTQTVLGGGRLGYNPFSGARFQGGVSLCDGLAFEAGGFFLGTQYRTQSVRSDDTGNPFLFRPFLNVDTGNPNAGSYVALPGTFVGGVQVASQSSLWGTNANLSGQVVCNETGRLDWLCGFRYLNLEERLDIRDARTDLLGLANFGGPATLPGDSFYFQDGFHTLNQFYGGQVGLRGETRLGCLVLSGNAKVSLGDTQQIITVQGSTTLLPAAGGVASMPGGILALPSNSGTFVHNRFTVIPEAGVQIGYDLTSSLRASVGYDFLWWSSVVRPGDQIVHVISAAQLPSSPSFGSSPVAVPGPVSHTTDFWAQGVSFSLGLRY
jgi:hypothetical protein